MKKLLAILISALTLCSLPACSPGSGGATADEAFTEIDAAKLPSKIDLRDFEGKNYVTPVKTQWFGDCWTFSLAGAAEISYLFENDMGVPAGEVNDKVNFSEKYISWYMFHGITKDDVVKGKVRASQVGEGFDPSAAEKERNNITAYFIGGPFVHDANLFGAGFGPVDESVSVKGENPYAYDDSWSGEWTLPLTAEYRNAPAAAFLRNSMMLPSPATFDSEGNYKLNEDGLNAIKCELTKGHGVSIALCASHSGINNKKRSAYDKENDKPDHAVTIVGYDDDYPKENFAKKNSEGDDTPPENGALIIKNSWGKTSFAEGDTDDGYLYISYYDHTLMDPLSYVIDGGSAVKHTTVNYDQYDLMMTSWYGTTDYDTETKMANVFDAEEDESLYQINYTTALPKTEVTYEIYKDVEDDNPSSGTRLEEGVRRHTFAGSYKIDLKSEYALKQGDKYAVVLTMKHETDENGGTAYTEVIPYSTEFYEGMTVSGVINKGESYLYKDGKWSDMSTMKESLTDRAYELCSEVIATDKALPKLELKGKDSMAVDNYPIKAILVPASEK